jgi:hypothetical protein
VEAAAKCSDHFCGVLSAAGAFFAYILRRVIRQIISLPRQARDKHRENSKRDAFCAGLAVGFPAPFTLPAYC